MAKHARCARASTLTCTLLCDRFGDVFRFDTRTHVWELVIPKTRAVPSRRRGHSAVLHVNPATGPEIIVFGGVGPNPEETKDIPLTDTWAFRVDAHE